MHLQLPLSAYPSPWLIQKKNVVIFYFFADWGCEKEQTSVGGQDKYKKERKDVDSEDM